MMQSLNSNHKIAATPHHITIIGVGNLGATLAFSLKGTAVPMKINLYDIDKQILNSQYIDLKQSCANDSTLVTYQKTESLNQINNQSLIVVTAGRGQMPGESRLDLIHKNYDTVFSILQTLIPLNPSARYIILTNPVDVILNKIYSDLRLDQYQNIMHQILSTGTLLDTHRLYEELGENIHDYDYSKHPMILGEHGDSQTLHNPTSRMISQKTLKIVEQSAYTIIKGKGYTNFAIASTTRLLIQILTENQTAIIPLSTYFAYESKNFRTALTLPIMINQGKLTGISNGFDTSTISRALQKSRAVITQISNK